MSQTQAQCPPLILLTATVVEMLPLAKQLHLVNDQSTLSWQGEVAGLTVIGQVTGMGPSRASQAIHEATQLYPNCRIVYAGFAGALDATLEVGDIISPKIICDEAGKTIKIDSTMPQTIVSVDRIISTPECKAKLANTTGASAVDMESHAAAQTALELGVSLTVIRSISDAAHQTLPTWSARCIKPNGQTNLTGALIVLLTGPWRLSILLQMQKRAKIASESLAYFVEGKIGQWALN